MTDQTDQTPKHDSEVDTSAEAVTAAGAASAEPETAVEPETAPEPESETAPEPESEPVLDTPAEVVIAADAAPVVPGATAVDPQPTPVPPPTPRPAPGPGVPKPPAPPVPSPAALAGRLHGTAAPKPSEYGRVDESGTVFVRTADGEREVGSYPGASHAEALAYFTRKYDELLASADLLLQRVTHTDLPVREGAEGLAKLREQTTEAHVVGDLAALDARLAQ
ncbi:MAG TPA: DUF349 domain-containing protein, partial [Dermatophilaceae bacterium]